MTEKLRTAAQAAYKAMIAAELSDGSKREWEAAVDGLKAALAEPTSKESLTVAEPVAWRYQNGITETEYLVWQKGTGGRNWTPLYAEPLPCPTCQSLARTVMMDQTGKA